jgi:lysophospholipase L1-like esterase
VIASICPTEAGQADRWEKAIQQIEARDRKNPPPKGEILLCGSSSARGWDVKKYFPDLKVTNRGFGGSQIHDSTQYAHRIILPHEPRIIMLYAGDNDIASGKTPETVFENFKLFEKKIHDALPKARIVYIAIKPSISRWKLVDKMRAANKLIAEHCKTSPLLDYADIDTPMIGDDGKPKKELFVKDGLHLSREGYTLWTSIVTPLLTK